jgi:hypothetical protein
MVLLPLYAKRQICKFIVYSEFSLASTGNEFQELSGIKRRSADAHGLQPNSNPVADCIEYVGNSMSQNRIGIRGLLQ